MTVLAYTVEIRDNADGHVCDVACVNADTGVEACATARRLVDVGEHALVYAPDGCGGRWFYQRIEPDR